MRNALGDMDDVAGDHPIFGEFGFDDAFAGKLQIDAVEIDVTHEILLRAADALDADALIGIDQQLDAVIGFCQQIEGAEHWQGAGALAGIHQAGLVALCPGREI